MPVFCFFTGTNKCNSIHINRCSHKSNWTIFPRAVSSANQIEDICINLFFPFRYSFVKNFVWKYSLTLPPKYVYIAKLPKPFYTATDGFEWTYSFVSLKHADFLQRSGRKAAFGYLQVHLLHVELLYLYTSRWYKRILNCGKIKKGKEIGYAFECRNK